MKIEIDDEERKAMLNAILMELHSDVTPGFIKWEGFRTNPIKRAFAESMKELLQPMMDELLNHEEFKDSLAIVGKLYVKYYLKKIQNRLEDGFVDDEY